MSLLSIQFRGESISKASSMIAIVPDEPGPHPVLYLLHGLSDDHTIWLRRTSVERYAEGRGLIIVMPDGHQSFYLNDPRPGGIAYEDHITQDVVGFCDRVLPAIPKASARAIAGLSMGGYGAIRVGLANPDLFSVACSHSGAVGYAHGPIEGRPELGHLARAVGEAGDCHALAAERKKDGKLPALRLDCGTDDFLLDSNRQFHAHLDEIGVEHVYEEFPGNHNWAYWDEHITATLDFVCEHVRPKA